MKKLIFFFLFYLAQNSLHAQTYFQKKLGGLAEDTGYSVQIDYDGNYLIIGTTQNVGAGGRDILLLKTDLSGNILLTDVTQRHLSANRFLPAKNAGLAP